MVVVINQQHLLESPSLHGCETRRACEANIDGLINKSFSTNVEQWCIHCTQNKKTLNQLVTSQSSRQKFSINVAKKNHDDKTLCWRNEPSVCPTVRRPSIHLFCDENQFFLNCFKPVLIFEASAFHGRCVYAMTQQQFATGVPRTLRNRF